MDVVVVGAGPSGCKTAEIIARKGYDVLILEEHPSVGIPTQCTGLVSNRIGKMPKKIILNKIKKARFCSKNKFFEIKSKRPAYVISRKGYDEYRAGEAKKAGAEIKLSTKFIDFENLQVATSNGNYQTKILVGADGPNSSVARIAGLELPDNFLKAVQVRAKSHFDPDTVELWFGDVAPGLFAWVVPESEEIARVGLMTDKNPNERLEKFLKERLGDVETTDRVGDFGKYGLIKKSASDNVLLVGDAACQIKPFSMGGLVYGQVGAEHAGKAIVKSLQSNDFSERFFKKNYEKRWKRELAGPIRKGILMKKISSSVLINRYSFSLVQKVRITRLSSFFDMDFLGKD